MFSILPQDFNGRGRLRDGTTVYMKATALPRLNVASPEQPPSQEVDGEYRRLPNERDGVRIPPADYYQNDVLPNIVVNGDLALNIELLLPR